MSITDGETLRLERELATEIDTLLDELEELRLAYAECSRQKNELLTKHKQYAEMIHTCGPTCKRAGCVNQRLRDAAQVVLDALILMRYLHWERANELLRYLHCTYDTT